jgi:hypothetical protein
MAKKLPTNARMKERQDAPGTCIDCGNDAYIRLASLDGREEMICGSCYSQRIRTKPPTVKKVRRVDPDLKLPRL